MINLLFCGNSGVFDGILTCALSIFKRMESLCPIHFYLFTMDVSHIKENYTPITQKQVEFFERVIKVYHPESKVTLIDVGNIYQEELAGCPNEQAYCSPYTLIRLLADKVNAMPDKVLYLDVDTMLNRDIRLLYDIDISDYEYAAARDHYGKYIIQPNYINAGVLLWNLKKMKETGIFERAREILRQKKLVFADQSALLRATTKKKMLPQKFNDQKFLHKHTVVRHFSKRMFWLPYPHTENIKQWHVERVHKVFRYHVFDDIFEEYLNLKEQYRRENQ